MALKKRLASLMVIELALNIIISYPAKAASQNATDAASAQSKVKNILAYLRAKAWVGEGAGIKLQNFTASPDIPDRLYTCLSASPDDQGCEVPADALQLTVRMAYASEERRQEPEVLVLASRTGSDVHIYRVSPRTGALERAVLLSKVTNGDRMEEKLELLDIRIRPSFWISRRSWIFGTINTKSGSPHETTSPLRSMASGSESDQPAKMSPGNQESVGSDKATCAIESVPSTYLINVCCSDFTSQRPFRLTKVSVIRARTVRPFLNVSAWM